MMERLKVSPRLKSIMTYAKFSRAAPRILFLRSDYWIDSACMNAARTLGWDFEESRVLQEGRMSREMIQQLLERVTAYRPDFILSVNLSGMDNDGLFAGLFSDLAIPYATWFVDDPRTILMRRTRYGGDFSVAFSWERAYVPYLTECGFGEAHYLPLAVDPTVFSGTPQIETPLPPTFVGSSMIRYAQREWNWFEDLPELKSQMESAFEAGRVTRENFAIGPAAFLGAEIVANLDAEAERHVELVGFIEGTRRLRRAFAETLGGALTFEVRGDDDWSEYGIVARPPVNYELELPLLYRNCPVNLNITSVQMATAVNQRVFDCPAAGGFLLTDQQSDSNALFDQEQEIACYRDNADCIERVRYFMGEPGLRREMTARAQERILREHTYAIRLQEMTRILRTRFA